MAGGRPPLGAALVDNLEGPDESKRRLKVILEVLSKEKTVEAACAELGIERARFYQLERAALEGALDGLEPRAPGRPPRPPASDAELEVERLRKKLAEAKFEAFAAKVREEIAEVMPHVLKRPRPEEGGEKKRRAKKPF